MLNKYMESRGRRTESNTKTGKFRGGRLVPVMAHPVRPSEGGMLMQTLTMELDPIAGRMITPIMAETVSVFVPVQAIDYIKAPTDPYAGITEVIRDKLVTGNPLFGLENEGIISQRCGIEPRSVGGVMRVNEMVRLAHNAAVNFLRQRKYDKAAQLTHTNAVVTPAILSQTVLDRLNGVLSPDTRINGAVNLDVTLNLPKIPIEGIGWTTASGGAAASTVRESGGNTRNHVDSRDTAVAGNGIRIEGETIGGIEYPAIYTRLQTVTGPTSQMSLDALYNAQTMDRLVREMESIVDDYPEMGEELILRWAAGLSADMDRIPRVLAERRGPFQRNIALATDSAGIQNETMRSDFVVQFEVNVPIPKTELGGYIITFAALKPDETLSNQPHPIASDVWKVDNFAADELKLDPVPVTGRDLNSQIGSGNESTIYLYTGYNELKRSYMQYGFTRNTNLTAVAAKTAVWQLQVPMSVTPSSVLYPETLDHYPFTDNSLTAEPCTYTISSNLVLQSPMIVGPSPVENNATINANDIFDNVAGSGL